MARTSPSKAALFLLACVALAQVQSSRAVCSGSGWTQIELDSKGKPTDSDNLKALTAIANDIIDRTKSSQCTVLAWAVRKACKMPVIKNNVIVNVRVDSTIKFKNSCKKSGSKGATTRYDTYASVAHLNKRQPSSILSNNFHCI